VISLLVVLQQYVKDHLGILPQNDSKQSLKEHSSNPSTSSKSEEHFSKNGQESSSKMGQEHSSYLMVILYELKSDFLSKLNLFMGDQISWIGIQKSDPKKAGVAIPVAKFPSFVRQVLEMAGGQVGQP
jgi:hypothetical protein